MKNFASVLVLFLLISTVSFSQAGTLDSSFSKDGIDRAKPGAGRAVALQTDGKIVVAGDVYDYRNDVTGITLIRYESNGRIDSSFGEKGSVFTYLGGSVNEGNSVAIQPNGKIVVAGTYRNYPKADFALVRYKENGTLDSAFGKNGKVFTDFGGGDYGKSVAIQADGKIVVAGSSVGDVALARYNPNGKLDSSFGINGKVTTDYLDSSSDKANSVAIQTDGKIVVAGRAIIGSQWDFALARYLPNGNLDSSFGDNGKKIDAFENSGEATSVIIQANGRIIAAGSAGGFAVARYKSNGDADSSFGENGHTIARIRMRQDVGNSMAIQDDGKIVMAGYDSPQFPDDKIAVTRFRRDGKTDHTFGDNGWAITGFETNAYGEAVVIQPDGKIVVAGLAGNSRAVLRYNGENTSVSKTSAHNFSDLQKPNKIYSNIHLSPNPVKDILHIDGLCAASGGYSSTKTISIIDAKAKLLQQVITANITYSFNIKQLAAGVYFVRIDEGDKITTLKFIKE